MDIREAKEVIRMTERYTKGSYHTIRDLNSDVKETIHRAAKCLYEEDSHHRLMHQLLERQVDLAELGRRLRDETHPRHPSPLLVRLVKGTANRLSLRIPSKEVQRDFERGWLKV